MTDQQRYIELIKKAKIYYESNAPEIRNLCSGSSFYDLVWCPGLENELNLWNYWQGGLRKNGRISADILLVGQDFGNYGTFPKRYNLSKKNAIYTEEYLEDIRQSKSKTDLKLIELFDTLGPQYHADVPNPLLFFTNLCLGYRNIEKISGGDLASQMRHDSVYLKELIGIIKPKVVICLGKATYISAITGILSTEELKKHQQQLIAINTNFNKALDNRENHISALVEKHQFEIFAVGHTGFYGEYNRGRNSTGNIKDDWKYIKEKL